MALSKQTAQKIIEVVARNPRCYHQIDSLFSIFGKGSGNARNGYIILMQFLRAGSHVFLTVGTKGLWLAAQLAKSGGGPKMDFWNPDKEMEPLICYGIAYATMDPLKQAIASGWLSEVVHVEVIFRSPDHYATWIWMKDGTDYIFDWHATLNVRDPLVCQTENWQQQIGGPYYSGFIGYDNTGPSARRNRMNRAVQRR